MNYIFFFFGKLARTTNEDNKMSLPFLWNYFKEMAVNYNNSLIIQIDLQCSPQFRSISTTKHFTSYFRETPFYTLRSHRFILGPNLQTISIITLLQSRSLLSFFISFLFPFSCGAKVLVFFPLKSF